MPPPLSPPLFSFSLLGQHVESLCSTVMFAQQTAKSNDSLQINNKVKHLLSTLWYSVRSTSFSVTHSFSLLDKTLTPFTLCLCSSTTGHHRVEPMVPPQSHQIIFLNQFYWEKLSFLRKQKKSAQLLPVKYFPHTNTRRTFNKKADLNRLMASRAHTLFHKFMLAKPD